MSAKELHHLPGNIAIDASELDALPAGSVVLSLRSGDIGCVHAKWSEHYLANLYGPWFSTGYEVSHPSEDIELPAQVIWHPDWAS